MNEIIVDNIFENSTGTYLNVDENCDWDFASFNGTFDQFLFFDCIHPTTKAHEQVAKEAESFVSDDDDDDDNCFIATSTIKLTGSNHYAVMFGLFMIIGFSGFLRKKN